MNDKYKLKKAYGLEHLAFDASGKVIICEYIGNQPEFDDYIDLNDLDWLLKALSVQQGTIYFKDLGKLCTGMDEIKRHCLIMKLSGM